MWVGRRAGGGDERLKLFGLKQDDLFNSFVFRIKFGQVSGKCFRQNSKE